MKRAWRLTEQQAFCLLDTQHFLTEEGVISRGTEHVQFPDAFLRRGRQQSLNGCSPAYNDTLGAAYTAYIKPGTHEDIYAIGVQQSIQTEPGRPIWCQTGQQNEGPLLDEHLKGPFGEQEKFSAE